MADTFGQPKTGQRELEGGGFYATPTVTCEAGKIAVFGADNLFGIPDITIPANTRGWFNNGSLGETRIFDKPVGGVITSSDGTMVYYDPATGGVAYTGGDTVVMVGF
jgi:hypothetical protein